jgi:hypothetical protein
MSAVYVVLSWVGVDHPLSLSEQHTDWPSTHYDLGFRDQSKSPFAHVDDLSDSRHTGQYGYLCLRLSWRT